MKPILFNTEIVKAILDGRKKQFRVEIDFCNVDDLYINENGKNVISINDKTINTITEEYIQSFINKNSKYKVGDIFYVKEPYYKLGCWAFSQMCDSEDHESTGENCFNTVAYEDDIDTYDLAYPVFKYDLESAETMGEKDARIFLKVTNVRVERLQDISDEDCIKEGISEVGFYPDEGFPLCSGYMIGKDDGKTALANNPQKPFGELWNSTAKDGYKYLDNPYVFVYEFERTVKEDN